MAIWVSSSRAIPSSTYLLRRKIGDDSFPCSRSGTLGELHDLRLQCARNDHKNHHGYLPRLFTVYHSPFPPSIYTMTTIQEPSSSTLNDFNGLVKNLHDIIDTIASQVVNTIDDRDPSLVSDGPSPPAPSELLSLFRKFMKLSYKFSSYATSRLEYLTMIAGAF